MVFHSPLRKSHLQPPSSQPPSSFSRQTGSTFRESLRRIPSSIFTRDQSKKDIEKKKSMDRMNAENMPRMAGERVRDIETVKAEKKPKSKTRKGLGEIFGWGNSSSTVSAAPVISPPSPLRRAPPTPPTKAPLPPIKDHTILPKPAPSVLTRKTSSNTFGTIISQATVIALRAPIPFNYGRPSIGDDPFGKDENGAEVVVHAPKRDQAPSVKSDFSAERRRDSTYSAKAVSTKTVASDEFSVHETAMRARMSSPRRVTMAAVIEEKKRMSNSPPRPASASAPTTLPLIAPPPRSDSLNYEFPARRPSNLALRARPANVPAFTSAPPPVSVVAPAGIDRKVSAVGLKKEKTKSRVWGFLGKKAGKGREDKENEPPKRDSIEIGPGRSVVLGSKIQLLQHGISRPNISSPVRATVPLFHVSHPSVDTSSADCSDSPSPMPRIAQSSQQSAWTKHSLIVDSPNKRDSGSTIASFTDFKAAIEAANYGEVDHCAQYLAGSKALPKRKSLNGLFGLSIKSSLADLQNPPISAKSFGSEHSAFEWALPTLRPLSEEMEMTFGSFGGNGDLDLNKALPDPSLRRVASATDKLVSLMSNFSFSPAPSPHLVPAASFTSLKNRISHSPTPIRKTKSAMLFHKANTPPVKVSTEISPLKYVLHRAHVRKMEGVSICADKPESDTPPPSSLLRKGMRNPFAPPSPDRGCGGSTTPAAVSGSPLAKKRVEPLTFGPAMGLAGFMDEQTEEDAGDVPADLQAMFKGLEGESIDLNVMGLPKPMMGRVAPRRPARAAPKISLPPVPPLHMAYQTIAIPTLPPLQTTLDQVQYDDLYSTPVDKRNTFDFVEAANRNSFDFTGEYEELDRGIHRASFVEALHRMGSSDMLKQRAMEELPPLPPLPAGPLYTIKQSPESVKTIRAADSSADMFADAPEPTRYASPVRARKAPFQGTFAFQQSITHGHTKPSPPLPEVAVPVQQWTRRHHRDESGLSIATLSSVGDVIDTADTAREYTNYFEANFAQHLAKSKAVGRHNHSRSISTDSIYNNQSDPRAPTRRAHHRRNSSIASVESIGVVGQVLSNGLPPNSLYNNYRRSGYISKHRRDGSSDSAWGRSDWASNHRRSTSSESTSSVVSVSRIPRPAGPSERMFQLDVGVQLTSITGSPADALSRHHARAQSWDSLAQESAGSGCDVKDDAQSVREGDSDHNRYSVSSSEGKRYSGSSDSVFGADMEEAEIKHGFFLKGMRPISAISSGMSSENGEDTFLDVKRYIKRGGKEQCFEGVGEETMTPVQETMRPPHPSLSGSISRPAKPTRRRPAHLIFGMSDPDTPGLTHSPTSVSSSRLSLETRFSSERSMGHFRQKSSAHFRNQATIKEEISMATLRPPPSSSSPQVRVVLSRENLRRQNAQSLYESEEEDEGDADEPIESISAWLRFQREADEVCRRTKSDYRDSLESQAAISEYPTPRFSPQSVADFLAQSAAQYKPLEKAVPAPREQAHRRKISLADARSLSSPYGLPLPKPTSTTNKPRGSLTTKFERSNSGNSNHGKSSDDPSITGTPKTGIFAHLMSDLVPSPPRSASSPFAQFLPQPNGNKGDVFNLAGTAVKRGKASDPPIRSRPLVSKENQAEVAAAENRRRVDSGTRRKALGWGRRRASDGPEQVIVGSKIIPLTSAGSGPRGKTVVVRKSHENRDKENIVPPVPSLKPMYKGAMESRENRDKENIVPPVPSLKPIYKGAMRKNGPTAVRAGLVGGRTIRS